MKKTTRPEHRIRLAKPKLSIPKLRRRPTAEDTVAYVAEFDRANLLAPLPYTFRGETVK